MAEMERPGDAHFAAHLRVSDADRHRVADILRDAAGDGRLDLDELEERLEAAYAAKTYADLVPITHDLPVGPTSPSSPPVSSVSSGPSVPGVRRPRTANLPAPVDSHPSSFAMMSTTRREGAWLCPEESTAVSVMGEVVLDLREATLASDDVTVTATAIMGSVKIIVDAHTRVHVSGAPIMGDFKQGRDKVPAEVDDASPLVRVKGMALMGEVSVVRYPPRGTPRRFLGNY